MKAFGLLRKIFTVLLAVAVVLISPVFSHDSALAARGSQSTSGGNFGGEESAVDAYRKLQKGTYDYRNQGFEGEGSQTGRLSNRLELTQRTGSKLQDRMDNRQDLTSKSSTKNAAKNIGENTQNAFQNAGEKVRNKLNMD